jgi:hypothetical protein
LSSQNSNIGKKQAKMRSGAAHHLQYEWDSAPTECANFDTPASPDMAKWYEAVFDEKRTFKAVETDETEQGGKK